MNRTIKLDICPISQIKGAGGGLHENFSEIDFLIVSDRGDEYLTAAFCPMEK